MFKFIIHGKIYHLSQPALLKKPTNNCYSARTRNKYKITEYLKESLSKEELEATIDKLGISPCELIRKAESEYVGNFKGKDMSEKDCLQAIIDFPKLMERPIVIHGNQAIIGRPPEKVLDLL